MANVLGELFSDIAASIRDGLGYQGTMKPAQFPGKIDEIVAMLEEEMVSRPSMDGMASTSNLKIVRGNFSPEADRTRITIEHGLGVMPDIIMVYQSGPPVGYDTVEDFVDAYPILSAWGVKSTVNVTTRSVMNLPGWGFATAYGIDDMPEEERPGGYIYCPDEDTFQVGRQATDGAVGLAANLDYYWIAISGIGSGAAEPVVQALTVTENGTYTPPEGVDGYSPVTVNVPEPVLQDKTITENGEYTADEGFAGLGKVLVEVAGAGGGSVVCKTGSRTSGITIEHGLGVTPAIFYIVSATGIQESDYISSAFGISSDFASKVGGITKGSYYSYTYFSGSINRVYGSDKEEFIDNTAQYPLGVLSQANESTIRVWNSNAYLKSGNIYYWIAIGFKE